MSCGVDLSYLCFFFKQKTAYEMRISDWSSDVCSSDLDHGRKQEALRRALDQDRLVGEEQVTARQREILVEEFAHHGPGARHALTQILDERTAHALAVGDRKEVAEALEVRLVRHVRGMRRHDELHRPRPICVQLRHKRGRNSIELPNEDLLHLRLEARVRLFAEDEVHAARRRLRLLLTETEQQLQKTVTELHQPNTRDLPRHYPTGR